MATENERRSSIAGFDSVADAPITSVDFERVHPRQVSTGSTRGTQTVGYGSIKIDGSNNRIQVDTQTSDVQLGNINGATDTIGFSVSDDTENMRLLAGTYPDGSVKIKLSQSGYDVRTATDDQLIWSSDFNSFKIVGSGTHTITKPNATATQIDTVLHGLNFTPGIIAYSTDGTYYFPLPDMTVTSGLSSITVVDKTDVYVDETSIYFYIVAGTGSGETTRTIKYYLLRETAN